MNAKKIRFPLWLSVLVVYIIAFAAVCRRAGDTDRTAAETAYYPYLVARGPGELAATWFSGRPEVLQAHVARIDIDEGSDPPRMIEAPPFRPDSWRRDTGPGAPLIHDTAGEYLLEMVS